ncbi:type II toxin-antitoxin system HipA family toxin [Trinickia dinghuensis]|uniref:Type II toxin-antitoxin system HipA family toxin n=1 Tax=Trinickia dinghuensis TaxID=2291023 RepID=A0A3D8K6L2_9BURK|nr:type II toxin-antitoxin system HipA family toxin [Trinickia dinghuensis]RDV00527.1 type II toxin-antitoxin system HipA family toxin [Trinickia dinghuensis]
MKSKTARLGVSELLEVHLGASGLPVGRVNYVSQGRREVSQFAYADSWLNHPDRFEVSPDLPLQPGYQPRRAANPRDSVFHFALADTEPDAWGRRVIERAHAKARRADPALAPLNELDYLCAVDDFSRVGALRFCKEGKYLRTVDEGRRTTPPFIELEQIYRATRAVETSKETSEDLRYLQGKGTSLGGMRPKCTVLDEDGRLAIGKFPSVSDTINVTRAEVLALRLARNAGIEAAGSRCVTINGTPIALIERFDRVGEDRRIPYLSAASMLQASRQEDRAYTEIVDIIQQRCVRPDEDAQQLWRRLVFNLLITNTDDHLQNLGFLYDGNGLWRLAPAFDLNPMPDKLRESKTWLTEDAGPIETVEMLLKSCNYFALSRPQALSILAQVLDAVLHWKHVALSAEVGLTAPELDAFYDAFEHDQTDDAREALGRPRLRSKATA